ncbi:ferrous iron transport protein B [Anaerolineales bacterium HSG24]|nr:ferrous iron transport protein B [Anaerolineales bacterium HSG24]
MASPPLKSASPIVTYDASLETEIAQLSTIIQQNTTLGKTYNSRWLAIQLLEADPSIITELHQHADLLQQAEASRARITAHYQEEPDILLAEQRYNFVHHLTHRVLTRPDANQLTWSDKVDQIVTHRYWGLPIFLGLMWLVFKMTSDLSAPMVDWIDGIVTGPITNRVMVILAMLGLNGSWLEAILVEGVIAGVGGVLVFVPVLMFLYLSLALLEDSGYMARAALVMERPMRLIGLPGKSFLPMVVGFGCTVPAYYATRILENKRDRILTGLLAPFMSCGARLPVYLLFATIFFPENPGLIVFGMYLLGIVVAIGLGFGLSRTLLAESEQSPLIMELPPYRLPTPRNIWMQIKNRTWAFIRKAWTVILSMSILMWLLMAIPVTGNGSFADTDIENSAFATIANTVAPAFAPLGFGSWEATGSLITGFIAKEIIISTQAQTFVAEANEPTEIAERPTMLEDFSEIITSFGVAVFDTLKSIPLIIGINLLDDADEAEPSSLMTAIREHFDEVSDGHGSLAALAFLVFVLIYAPCMVAIAAERQELGSHWMWFSLIGQTGLAWLLGLLVFQGGLLFLE